MQYERPFFEFSIPLPSKQQTTSLASGRTVMTSLQNIIQKLVEENQFRMLVLVIKCHWNRPSVM